MNAGHAREMRRTPNIDHLRVFRPRDCPDRHPYCLTARNAYELQDLENEPKLFASERMVDRFGREILDYKHGGRVYDWRFGDWDCDAFFLMQDSATVVGIQERIDSKPRHPDPFSQRNFIEEPTAKGAPTNRNLHELAGNLRCRKLAGNAFVGILKGGDRGKTKP